LSLLDLASAKSPNQQIKPNQQVSKSTNQQMTAGATRLG
jgi:hypothetical protein